MSRQIIVSPFNSHTLSYWPNIPAPSTFAPQQARIKRSRLFSQSLFGRAGLLRQIGASDDHSAVTRAWAESLNYENNVTFPTGPNFYNSRSDFVTSMVYDEYTRSIIAGAELYEYEGGRDRSSLVVASKDSDRSYFRAKKRERVAPSKVTSIVVSPSRIMLATISGGGLPASLHLHHLNESRGDQSNRMLPYQILRVRHQSQYWASSANPRHDICTFAIAGSDGTPVIKEGQGDFDVIESTRDPYTVDLDWLSPNVLIKGRRFGGVKLWDMRTHAENAGSRLRHPTKITCVRCIDENIIAVAGMQSILCTYDLRYARYAKPFCSSQYLDCFPTYRNNLLTYQRTRLAVHQNILAAATDDGRVQIFDVKKGVDLSSGINHPFRNYSCVRFVDERNSGEALKLMAAVGPKIEWWSFGGSTGESLRRQQGQLRRN